MLHIRQRPKGPQTNIIGVSFGYHDSACCLLQAGALVSAVQEERFTRVKNDATLPTNALQYCLRQGGITIADVDAIAFYENPEQKLSRQAWMAFIPDMAPDRRKAIAARLVAPHPERVMRECWGFEGPMEFVGHHLSHAASSYYFSGFDEAALLTVDGVGEWATTTYGRGTGSRIECFEQVDFPDSLGFLYSAITGYLGFEVNEGEYKVMGLAPYGRPKYAEKIRRLIDVEPGGQYRLNLHYFGFLHEDGMFTHALCDLLGQSARVRESPLSAFHMDVAASVQVVLQDILLEKVKYLYSRHPSENLCMAGGVALNVVANAHCRRNGPFENLFVQPAAGDAGSALGAAAVAHLRLTGARPDHQVLRHAYLGPEEKSADVRKTLHASGAKFHDFSGDEPTLLAFAADRLAAGDVLGWIHGRMEFGPRALGARSILADPRRPEMRDRINALVKMREGFRPFAPAVLEKEAHLHFELDRPSPFMLETCRVISPIDLPAITHVDGSARVQTVDEQSNGRFARLLRAFERRTGCPILLNTSFNLRGEPIVCSTVDALRCFLRSDIDVLIVEDYAIERAGIPRGWVDLDRFDLDAELPPDLRQRTVYTLL
jgi:carbamoyltransferase